MCITYKSDFCALHLRLTEIEVLMNDFRHYCKLLSVLATVALYLVYGKIFLKATAMIHTGKD